MTIGDTIRIKRQEAGIRSTELARIAGITPTGLWMIEAGRRSPMADTLMRIARALGCTMDSLYAVAEPDLTRRHSKNKSNGERDC